MHFYSIAALALLTASAGIAQGFVPGSFETSDVGCPFEPGNFIYEIFSPGSFDLDGSGLDWVPNGQGGYDVVPAAGGTLPFAAASATAIDIGASEQSVTGSPILSSAFPYPGGTTSRLWISANGQVFFQSSRNARCCDGSEVRASALAPMAAPAMSIFGTDLDPSTSPTGSGRIWFDEQTVLGQQVAVVTWDAVGEFGVTPPLAFHNCQMQLWDDGRVTFRWFGNSPSVRSVFVGWSAGGGTVADAGAVDFSRLPISGGDGTQIGPPFSLLVDVPPRENAVFVLRFADVPAIATAGALLLGTQPIATALDSLGMPGCHLLTNANIGAVPAFVSPAFSIVSPGMIPAGNVGLTLEVQGVLLAPAVNPLGVVVSNRGSLVVGSDPDTATGLVVRLDGADTFYCGGPLRPPFWTVANRSTSGETIQWVRFDFSASSDPMIAASTVFDTDGNCDPVGDFLAGNSAGICARPNAYRGTDVTTGLVYANTDPSPCDGTAQTGHVLSNPGFQLGTFQTVDFSFTSFGVGDVFAFDVDTDLGPDGADGLHRIVVTIRTDQRTVRGELSLLDGVSAIRAF